MGSSFAMRPVVASLAAEVKQLKNWSPWLFDNSTRPAERALRGYLAREKRSAFASAAAP